MTSFEYGAIPIIGWPGQRWPIGIIPPAPPDALYFAHIFGGFSGFRYLFGFVAVDEELGKETPADRLAGPGTSGGRLTVARREMDLGKATHEVALDFIDAGHFMKQTSAMEPCAINDPEQAKIRRKQLGELLRDEMTGVAVVHLSRKDPLENSYIDNFQPSTWHRLVIGPRNRIPVDMLQDFSSEEGNMQGLYYAGPVTPVEGDRLFEFISLNHLPDAGIDWPAD